VRWSQIFIPTLREDPASAEAISHKLLLRGGFIRQLTAGVYILLPLAQRVRLKVIEIIRQEMNRIGGQEFLFSALQPAELWQTSGRWDVVSEIMFRLCDRKDTPMALGITHEEAFAFIASQSINSYRQLPQIWYQIQTKFRDEARPKSGLLRVREFTMKDSYSLDIDKAGLDKSYQAHYDAYCTIYKRCGLTFTAVQANSGAMGGSESTEFMVWTDAGEDRIILCKNCGYAANIEKAIAKIIPYEENGSETLALEQFPTPGIRTIEQLVKFSKEATAEKQIKSLIFLIKSELIIILMRGDHELNEAKLQSVLGTSEFRPASEKEIQEALGALPGSLGAVNVTREKNPKIKKIIADHHLKERKNMVTGANKDDLHWRGVSVSRDIKVDEWADLHVVNENSFCDKCDHKLEMVKGLEIGHIFKLGTKYSEAFKANALLPDGSAVPIVMGSYGIGVERIIASAVELYNDNNGIIWPLSIAPFSLVITPVSVKDEKQMALATKIYDELNNQGIDILLDDRDERPGVKFKDADLIGIPFRMTIGKSIEKGEVEFFKRSDKSIKMIPIDSATKFFKEQL
jgi:prolyl-tRNA synthetase